MSKYRILLVATIAEGGGDLYFSSRAAFALASLPFIQLSVIAVAQARRDPTAAAALLAPLLPQSVPLLACYSRGPDNVLRPAPLPSFLAQSDALPPACDALLVCPLHLFDGPAEACASLGLSPLPLLPRMLTVRELGQGRFLPPAPPEGVEHASAGLARGEWGLWAAVAPLPPPLLEAAPFCDVFVGHFRSPEHGAALGRLAASVLLLRRGGSGSECSGSGLATLRAPGDSHAALLRALRDHPGVAHVEVVAAEREQPFVLLHVTPRTGSSVATAPSQRWAARPFTLRLEVAPTGMLPRDTFLSQLGAAAGALVTGDASLCEALSFSSQCGLPFCYSVEPHKAFFAAALEAALPPLLRVWCAFVTAGGKEGGGAKLSAVWEGLSAELLRDGGCGEQALRRAFQDWSSEVLAQHGVLDSKLQEWAKRARGGAVAERG